MSLDENKLKMSAKERREQSDKILEEVFAQLMTMKKMKKVQGHSVAIMKKNNNSS
jgi:hypothetical protein